MFSNAELIIYKIINVDTIGSMEMFFYAWAIIIILVASSLEFKSFDVFHKLNRVRTSSKLTGKEAAQYILRQNGISGIQIVELDTEMTDSYNSKTRTLYLSHPVANDSSVAAITVAAHECGHILQHYTGNGLLLVRDSIAPICRVLSYSGVLLCVLGICLTAISPAARLLILIGIILFSLPILFHCATLPLELDASKKAMEQLKRLNLITNAAEEQDAKKMLFMSSLSHVIAIMNEFIMLIS